MSKYPQRKRLTTQIPRTSFLSIMKKTYNQIIFIIAVLVMSSCSTTTPLTPSDVKLMTTKQYKTDYETVYESVMSLLQSEQFTIEQTDYQTGLITATKNIYEKNFIYRLIFAFTITYSTELQLPLHSN